MTHVGTRGDIKLRSWENLRSPPENIFVFDGGRGIEGDALSVTSSPFFSLNSVGLFFLSVRELLPIYLILIRATFGLLK